MNNLNLSGVADSPYEKKSNVQCASEDCVCAPATPR